MIDPAFPARQAVIDVLVAGERVQLLPDRALFWPRTETLIVADVHLGKAAAFRRKGVAVPSGGTRDDLDRLECLIEQTRARRLLVLGDLFHTRVSPEEPTIDAFDLFREHLPELCFQVIRGNHDRAIERLPAEWRIEWTTGSLFEPPFVFAHEPAPDARGYVLAGHIHPVVRLRARADSLRLPVFWFGAESDVGVLPSFGAFTGGYRVSPGAADQVVAVTPHGLVFLQANAMSEPAPCIS